MLKYFALFSCVIIPLCLLCILFIDARLAQTTQEILSHNRFAWEHTRHIPNILPFATPVVTITMVACYLAFRRNPAPAPNFFFLAACSVPVAFFLKVFLQDAFGRTSIRVWLKTGGQIDFNWFHPLENIGAFPSGHMTVFTAFFFAVWLYYPSLRMLAVSAVFLLGCALVVTNYHFLGDLFAGIYVGVLVTGGIYSLSDKINSKRLLRTS